MKPKISLTFDDGLLDQFKWARLLGTNGLTGTFYINPFSVENPGFLTYDMLKKMQGEWGHIIANHLWIHESPSYWGDNWEKMLKANFYTAEAWLNENGFMQGSEMVAMTFGTDCGAWEEKHVNVLKSLAVHVRDYSMSPLTCKVDNNFAIGFQGTGLLVEEDKHTCYCFHGNHETVDEDFTNLIEKILEEQENLKLVRDLRNVE